MTLKHPRSADLCSPTSISMLLSYLSNFKNKNKKRKEINLGKFVPNFADKAHDDCYLDIYGNWPLNIAQAYDSCKGLAAFRIERMNGFSEIYRYLKHKIPVAVSVRGKLKNGLSKGYHNGHFMVVVGWDKEKQLVICIDPAFTPKYDKKLGKKVLALKQHSVNEFLRAWNTSRNLAYVGIPKVFLKKVQKR